MSFAISYLFSIYFQLLRKTKVPYPSHPSPLKLHTWLHPRIHPFSCVVVKLKKGPSAILRRKLKYGQLYGNELWRGSAATNQNLQVLHSTGY